MKALVELSTMGIKAPKSGLPLDSRILPDSATNTFPQSRNYETHRNDFHRHRATLNFIQRRN